MQVLEEDGNSFLHNPENPGSVQESKLLPKQHIAKEHPKQSERQTGEIFTTDLEGKMHPKKER